MTNNIPSLVCASLVYGGFAAASASLWFGKNHLVGAGTFGATSTITSWAVKPILAKVCDLQRPEGRVLEFALRFLAGAGVGLFAASFAGFELTFLGAVALNATMLGISELFQFICAKPTISHLFKDLKSIHIDIKNPLSYGGYRTLE
jgi:hypothetical protein